MPLVVVNIGFNFNYSKAGKQINPRYIQALLFAGTAFAIMLR